MYKFSGKNDWSESFYLKYPNYSMGKCPFSLCILILVSI